MQRPPTDTVWKRGEPQPNRSSWNGLVDRDSGASAVIIPHHRMRSARLGTVVEKHVFEAPSKTRADFSRRVAIGPDDPETDVGGLIDATPTIVAQPNH